MSEKRTGGSGTMGPTPAPFDLWTQWMRANMGAMSAAPGASVPWLASPGVTTGDEAEDLPSGALRNDPLLSTMEKLWDANPVQNVLPINWVEISKSLQTLWQREMSDPAAAMRRAADFNAKVWGATFESVRAVAEESRVGECAVALFVNQIAVTKHAGVEITQPSALLWRFRDGLVSRLEFHLDREAALKAGGI